MEDLTSRMTQVLSQNQTQAHTTDVDSFMAQIGIKLDGSNYALWSQIVEMYISGKDMLGYINGELPQPSSTDPCFPKWRTENAIVKGWLINSMDTSLIGNFIQFPTAKMVWDSIATTYFDASDTSQVYDLKRQVTKVKQAGGSIEKYYNDLQRLWIEIDFCRPNPMVCSIDTQKHNSIIEEDRVYVFLNGLEDRLDKIRSHVLQLQPFPTVEQAYAHVRREDIRQAVMITGGADNSSGVFMASKSKAPSEEGGGCIHFGKLKHTHEICFKEKKQHEATTNGGSVLGSSSSAAISMSSPPKYDVFLSFRGEDTRDKFISHLYAELCTQKIETFIDYKLGRGDEISPALYKAIEESMIYVVILSKNYASSTWCLDELTKILKCRETYGRDVIPVFYEVDPSDVRHQRQSYAEAFVKHQHRFKDDQLEEWKAALTQVACLSGWDSQVTRSEHTLIEEIVKDVLKKLNLNCSFVSNDQGMIGIDKHIEQIQSLLHNKSEEVQIVGIWGMGGIGKTTIARAIYHKLASQFSSSSIILNVQQEIKRCGLQHIRSKYRSELLGENNTSSRFSFSYDDRPIKWTKALLVLDDVSSSDQFKDLIGSSSSFGCGSTIIVTTRDMQVLKNIDADGIYEVKEMDFHKSLRLFCLNAFKQSHPISDYVELTAKILHYARGVPLTLKILGSLLCGRTKEAWESQLRKLDKLPENDIFKVLKLSYKGLDEEQKDIFLDIACFYRGHLENVVAQTLDSCGFSAHIGMDILKDRSLHIPSSILERSSGLIVLHGCHNLEMFSVSNAKMGARLHGCSTSMFLAKQRCKRLRFVSLSCSLGDNFGHHLIRDKASVTLDPLDYDELNKEPKDNIQLLNLALLREGSPSLFPSLNEFCWLDLSYCESLFSLPIDLFKLKFLRRLYLSGCLNLEKFPEIEETMESLTVLMLDRTAIKELPSTLHHLVNLEELSLFNCQNLVSIPPSIGCLSKLNKLSIMYCESLETFPSSIFKLKLTKLDLLGCSMLKIFPEILEPAETFVHINLIRTAIKELPSSLEYLVGLQTLRLNLCTELVSLPNSIVNLNHLSELDCSGCCSIVNLPESIAHLSSLKSLDLSDCERLECIPQLPPSMNHLFAYDCPSIGRVMPNLRLELPSNSKQGIFEFHFTNSQELNGIAHSNIGAEAWLRFTEVAYRDVFFRFPGSAVPHWFPYRCQGRSVSVNNDSKKWRSDDSLIGFALCVALGCEDTITSSCSSFRYTLTFGYDGCTHILDNQYIQNIFYWKGQPRSVVQDHTFIMKYHLDFASIDNRLFDAHSFTFEISEEREGDYSLRFSNDIGEPRGSKAA
ncbi:hypothetical protein TSUD_73680 [Trifolium subterraneum]|uniref:ADP-ribosyl cyclase/cyclic ADP-ribose hydrolase n=1 Tax=Trifolium subterraneum TaxID=3900 RepID=A0A2Z6LGW9_TRISU|nr:hypothetical protein TSUD_73680 [Trifolium subterraneum]